MAASLRSLGGSPVVRLLKPSSIIRSHRSVDDKDGCELLEVDEPVGTGKRAVMHDAALSGFRRGGP